MSRLCRLKSYKNIGEDGEWAYHEIIALRAERDALKTLLAESEEDNVRIRSTWTPPDETKLTAERDALKKDAERYRWVKENATVHYFVNSGINDNEFEELDEGIDAAMKETK